MTIDTNLQVGVAIFLKLSIHPNIQKEILSKRGFKIPDLGISTTEIAPGISMGPTVIPIAESENAKIAYISERYLLRIEASLNKIREVSEEVLSAFENSGYNFSEMVRYCEFNFPEQSLEMPDVVNKIRKMISVSIGSDISAIFGIELKPYSFSLSYPETALSDEWTHITFIPESNNPKKTINLKITKRTPTYSEMLRFLSDIESKVEGVMGLFVGVRT
ncbi:MAG: hypothetical protein WBC40_08225 [Halobacteriota archaeon]